MPLDPADIRQMAEGYTQAWCSRSGEAVASFFAENATSVINAGEPTVGRPAIAEAMGAFFEDFPDLVLRMDDLRSGGIRRSTSGHLRARTADPAAQAISCG
jgi:uncharacterized protein (TIGR02246 family)